MSIFKRLFSDQSGGSAILISAAMIPMIAAVGSAIDGGYAIVVRKQLNSAVDAAALAGGRAYFDDDRDQQARNYFDSNFTSGTAGIRLQSYASAEGDTSPGGGSGDDDTALQGKGNGQSGGSEKSVGTLYTYQVSASATVSTLFMQAFGYTEIPVSAKATAARQSAPLELMLALDNTGSMNESAGKGKKRIQALKDATRLLLASLYGEQDPTNPGGGKPNPNLRIGIIPYTTFVNVGGLLRKEEQDRGVAYLDMPAGYDYDPKDPVQWKGCVDADMTVNTITSATNAQDAAAFANAWDTKDYEPGRNANPKIKPAHYPSIGIPNGWGGWEYDDRYAVPNPYPAPARFPAPQADWPKAQLFPSNKTTDTASGSRSPNAQCPSEAMLPDSRPFGQLVSWLETEMRAYTPGWGTFSNVALQWSIRMLSPEYPFAGTTRDSMMQKAIVVMTDGYMMASNSKYARHPYGFPDEKGLVNDDSPSGDDMVDALEKRFERLCIEAKAANIAVYVVTLALSGSDKDKDLYRNCATTPAMYFDADDANDLQESFTSIGTDLSALRLIE